MTSRLKALDKLSASFPEANQRVAQGMQEARKTQLQETIKQARPSAGPAQAQQLGAQQAAKAGQIQLGAQQQNQQQQTQVGQLGLQQQAREQRQTGFEGQIALTQNQRAAADKLASLDIDLKNKLLDQNLQFKRDQAGQTVMNQHQLADYALANAKSQEEWLEHQQTVSQAYEKEMILLKHSFDVLSQTLQQGHTKEGKKLDFESKKRIANARIAIEQEMTRKSNDAKNKAAMWRTGGKIIGGIGGGVAGFVSGGPAGAVAGAKMGMDAGETLGTLASTI